MNAHSMPPKETPPPGMLEYEARCAIRDLIRLYGFEEARQMVAHFLLDEAERKPRQ
ncbi:MAG: hypothetical protein M9939_00900 [Mesorhizobium sp.]|nr:hypothetical protein [Mesorhizobium sp.]MCO5159666.1 hypothetical protein [Mesorhizobium sp.]